MPFRDKAQRACQQGTAERLGIETCGAPACPHVCVLNSSQVWHMTSLSSRHEVGGECGWEGEDRAKRECVLPGRQAGVKEQSGKSHRVTVRTRTEEKNGRIYTHSCQLCRTANIAGSTGPGVTPPHNHVVSLRQITTTLKIELFIISLFCHSSITLFFLFTLWFLCIHMNSYIWNMRGKSTGRT